MTMTSTTTGTAGAKARSSKAGQAPQQQSRSGAFTPSDQLRDATVTLHHNDRLNLYPAGRRPEEPAAPAEVFTRSHSHGHFRSMISDVDESPRGRYAQRMQTPSHTAGGTTTATRYNSLLGGASPQSGYTKPMTPQQPPMEGSSGTPQQRPLSRSASMTNTPAVNALAAAVTAPGGWRSHSAAANDRRANESFARSARSAAVEIPLARNERPVGLTLCPSGPPAPLPPISAEETERALRSPITREVELSKSLEERYPTTDVPVAGMPQHMHVEHALALETQARLLEKKRYNDLMAAYPGEIAKGRAALKREQELQAKKNGKKKATSPVRKTPTRSNANHSTTQLGRTDNHTTAQRQESTLDAAASPRRPKLTSHHSPKERTTRPSLDAPRGQQPSSKPHHTATRAPNSTTPTVRYHDGSMRAEPALTAAQREAKRHERAAMAAAFTRDPSAEQVTSLVQDLWRGTAERHGSGQGSQVRVGRTASLPEGDFPPQQTEALPVRYNEEVSRVDPKAELFNGERGLVGAGRGASASLIPEAALLEEDDDEDRNATTTDAMEDGYRGDASDGAVISRGLNARSHNTHSTARHGKGGALKNAAPGVAELEDSSRESSPAVSTPSAEGGRHQHAATSNNTHNNGSGRRNHDLHDAPAVSFEYGSPTLTPPQGAVVPRSARGQQSQRGENRNHVSRQADNARRDSAEAMEEQEEEADMSPRRVHTDPELQPPLPTVDHRYPNPDVERRKHSVQPSQRDSTPPRSNDRGDRHARGVSVHDDERGSLQVSSATAVHHSASEDRLRQSDRAAVTPHGVAGDMSGFTEHSDVSALSPERLADVHDAGAHHTADPLPFGERSRDSPPLHARGGMLGSTAHGSSERLARGLPPAAPGGPSTHATLATERRLPTTNESLQSFESDVPADLLDSAVRSPVHPPRKLSLQPAVEARRLSVDEEMLPESAVRTRRAVGATTMTATATSPPKTSRAREHITVVNTNIVAPAAGAVRPSSPLVRRAESPGVVASRPRVTSPPRLTSPHRSFAQSLRHTCTVDPQRTVERPSDLSAVNAADCDEASYVASTPPPPSESCRDSSAPPSLQVSPGRGNPYLDNDGNVRGASHSPFRTRRLGPVLSSRERENDVSTSNDVSREGSHHHRDDHRHSPVVRVSPRQLRDMSSPVRLVAPPSDDLPSSAKRLSNAAADEAHIEDEVDHAPTPLGMATPPPGPFNTTSSSGNREIPASGGKRLSNSAADEAHTEDDVEHSPTPLAMATPPPGPFSRKEGPSRQAPPSLSAGKPLSNAAEDEAHTEDDVEHSPTPLGMATPPPGPFSGSRGVSPPGSAGKRLSNAAADEAHVEDEVDHAPTPLGMATPPPGPFNTKATSGNRGVPASRGKRLSNAAADEAHTEDEADHSPTPIGMATPPPGPFSTQRGSVQPNRAAEDLSSGKRLSNCAADEAHTDDEDEHVPTPAGIATPPAAPARPPTSVRSPLVARSGNRLSNVVADEAHDEDEGAEHAPTPIGMETPPRTHPTTGLTDESKVQGSVDDEKPPDDDSDGDQVLTPAGATAAPQRKIARSDSQDASYLQAPFLPDDSSPTAADPPTLTPGELEDEEETVRRALVAEELDLRRMSSDLHVLCCDALVE